MGFSFVLPLRSGSQRVKNKNTKQFSTFNGGLTELKITQLLNVKSLEKCYITTDDIDVLDIASNFNDSRLIIDKRPKKLCQSTTKVEDLIKYIGDLVESEHIYWVHATSPFVNEEIYEKAWKSYLEHTLINQRYDSLMSVHKIQQFIWDEKLRKVINNSSSVTRWPQTQDLTPLFEINHAFYINSKRQIQSSGDRIGKKPYCFELDKLSSIDVDWPEDFDIAEKLYNSI